mgnify:CR=1 FL=1
MQTRTIENYCKVIYIFDKGNGSFSKDISNYLGISKISVSLTLNKLKKEGYITMQKYGKIKLTQKGKKLAQKIIKRYLIIKQFLEIIGANKKTLEKEACAVEHSLSDDTIAKLSDFLNAIKNQKNLTKLSTSLKQRYLNFFTY